MARGKNKADHRADLRGEPFVGLPAAVLYSPAYADLSLWARAVLLEVLGRFNGYNNGAIGISQRELTQRLGTSNFHQITKATAELMEHGFIDVSVEGKWKQRHARLYRLTFLSSGKAAPFQAATNEYARWTPPKAFSGADHASAGNTRFADRASAGKLGLADNASAATHAKQPIWGIEHADSASALICKPYRGTERKGAETGESDPEIAGGIFGDPAGGPVPSPSGNVLTFPRSSSQACKGEGCAAPVVGGGRGKPKLYCSEKCRKRAEGRRRCERKKAAGG